TALCTAPPNQVLPKHDPANHGKRFIRRFLHRYRPFDKRHLVCTLPTLRRSAVPSLFSSFILILFSSQSTSRGVHPLTLPQKTYSQSLSVIPTTLAITKAKNAKPQKVLSRLPH